MFLTLFNFSILKNVAVTSPLSVIIYYLEKIIHNCSAYFLIFFSDLSKIRIKLDNVQFCKKQVWRSIRKVNRRKSRISKGHVVYLDVRTIIRP